MTFPRKEADTQPEGPHVRCPLCLGEGRVLEEPAPGVSHLGPCTLCGGNRWVTLPVHARWVDPTGKKKIIIP